MNDQPICPNCKQPVRIEAEHWHGTYYCPPLPEAPRSETGAPEKSRRSEILEGLHGQNEPAEFHGRKGFWVQPDALFIEAKTPQFAIMAYRAETVAHSHNHFCGSILHAKAQEQVADLQQRIAELVKERDAEHSRRMRNFNSAKRLLRDRSALNRENHELTQQLSAALTELVQLRLDIEALRNASVVVSRSAPVDDELAKLREERDDFKARTEFIEEGLPQAEDLEDHYVWAVGELTRRRAYTKPQIARIIGELRAQLTLVKDSKAEIVEGLRKELVEAREENARLVNAGNELVGASIDGRMLADDRRRYAREAWSDLTRKEGDEPCAQTTCSTSTGKSKSQHLPTQCENDTPQRTVSASEGAANVPPVAAPEEWRMLEVGEVIQEGDEFKLLRQETWQRAGLLVGETMIASMAGDVRRRTATHQEP